MSRLIPEEDYAVAVAHQNLVEAHKDHIATDNFQAEVEIREDELRAVIRKHFVQLERSSGWEDAMEWLIEQVILRTHESTRGF